MIVINAVVIGQSHTEAIAAAALKTRETAERISVYRLRDTSTSGEMKSIRLADAVALAAEIPPETLLFLSVIGTYHNIIGLLRSGDDFDFLVDESDVPDRQVAIRIPNRTLAIAFEQQFNAAEAVRKIASSTNAPRFLLSIPPPKQSSRFIRESLLKQKKGYRGKQVDDYGIERPETRRKLWLLETRLAAGWAKTQGIGFVEAPPETVNEDGFLARKYYSDDATHANAEYGELVLEQIRAIIRERRGGESRNG